ncbi:MAG TPA: ornithine cyclodeaminase family protein [Actinomycetota bacterium]|nr:ornithine cyclodeaminase family protein [Actinomycetota bacterium]
MSDLLVITQAEVPDLLPMARCIDVMEEALSAVARGDAVLPLRQMVELPSGDGDLLAVMPASLAGDAGVKAITVFPRNEGTELHAHQGIVVLFETERGRPVAVIDATAITAIRTAAVSGAATRALARDHAGDLAILGSGTQARTHLEAMAAVRRLRRVRVWSRNEARARAFADATAPRTGVEVEVVASAEQAVEGADIVCTATSAREPILRGEWLAAGTHINAVGYSGRQGRELDGEAVARSRLFCDRRESVLNESGDFLLAREESAVDDGHIAGEIGEVFIGKVPGRTSPDEITLFESLGLAVEDVAAARAIHDAAVESGVGTRVPLGGLREA